jgi:hypothetical protein
VATSAKEISTILKRIPHSDWKAFNSKAASDAKAAAIQEQALHRDLVEAHEYYWKSLRPILNSLREKPKIEKVDETFAALLAHYRLFTFPDAKTKYLSKFKDDVEYWFNYGDSAALAGSQTSQGGQTLRGKIAEVVIPGVYRKSDDRPMMLATVKLEATQTKKAV